MIKIAMLAIALTAGPTAEPKMFDKLRAANLAAISAQLVAGEKCPEYRERYLGRSVEIYKKTQEVFHYTPSEVQANIARAQAQFRDATCDEAERELLRAVTKMKRLMDEARGKEREI